MIVRTLFVIAVLVAMPAAASAQPEPLAAGREARAHGDHERALAYFTRAWDLDANVVARAEMGLSELALGRFAIAEAHLGEALALATGTELEARRAELEAAVREAASHLASVDVHCPPGCEVSLDGERVGSTPLGHLVRVAAGDHVFAATLVDHAPVSVSITIAASEVSRVDLSPVLIDRRPILERVGPAAFGTIGTVALVAGSVALVVGGVMVGLAVDRASTLHGPSCAPTPAVQCPSVVADHELFRTTAIVTLIAGGVLAAVGAVFLAIAPEDETAAPSVACGPAFELGASCIVTF
jgi:hypothetical protein